MFHQYLWKCQHDIAVFPMYDTTLDAVCASYSYSRLHCCIEGFYIWPFTYPRKYLRIKVRWSRRPRNGCCSFYPSFLQLRRHFLSTVIRAPLAAGMLKPLLPTRTQRVSLLFSSYFVIASITVSKINKFLIIQTFVTALYNFRSHCAIILVLQEMLVSALG